jgi:uncharacterized protein (TIGR02391 family)
MTTTYHGPVPDELVRELPTPELALQLLAALGKQDPVNANNVLRGAEHAYAMNGVQDGGRLLEKLADAWAWLESKALIGPHPKNTSGDWRRITDAGRELAQDPAAAKQLWAAERLAGDLDLTLESKVRPLFNLGDYETACFAALKTVEVAVRDASGLPGSIIGVDLMRQAFKVSDGALADAGAHRGEQVAMMELFAGAIGAFKNPTSHRNVHFDDPVEAAEVIQLADLLLRLLRRAERRTEE